MGPQQSAKQYYQNLHLLQLFVECQDKKVRFLWNTGWRSAASFICFDLRIKQNRVICLLAFDLFLVFGCLSPLIRMGLVLGWVTTAKSP